MRLMDKVAVVTGGSRGIGRAIGLAMAAEGADVAVNYRASKERALGVVREVESMGRRAIAIEADVSDARAAEALVQRALSTFGRIDILVNNAGILSTSSVVDMPVEMWDEMILNNLRSVFLVTKFALPGMLERKYGKVVNISSVLAVSGRSEYAHYVTAKAGIIGFTKSLAIEVGPRNINVNAIAVGQILTEMMANQTEEWKALRQSQYPLGRFGLPEDIAVTAVFLASEDARQYTGQTFHPNSGWLMP